jgi:peroxiredoxin
VQSTRRSRVGLTISLVAVGSLTLLAGAFTAEASMGGSQFQVFSSPTPANDFKMGTLDGKTFTLSDHRGKVVLLNFWRHNCPYCVLDKRGLKKMLRGLGRHDLEAICVDLWDSPSQVSRLYGKESNRDVVYAVRVGGSPPLVENKVHGRLMGYYVINDANEAIYEIKGFPSTYVIDREGRVVATHLGMVNWTSQSVRGWLLNLLGPSNSIGATTSARADSYALPEWIDRLLTKPGSFKTVPVRDLSGQTAIPR